MDCIPLIFVCGTSKRNRPVETQGRFCPNCQAKDGVVQYKTYSRFSFCFIPLCRVGSTKLSYRCQRCGAQYPG